MIPGPINGNPGTISSGCVKSMVSMILPLGTSFLSIWDGSWNAKCQVLYDERELRKDSLRRQFGVDFDSGDVELVD
jgi:hypothetical protein